MFFFFFKQKTAYEMRISDWSSDVCSSDLSDADLGASAKTSTVLRAATTAGVSGRPGDTPAGRPADAIGTKQAFCGGRPPCAARATRAGSLQRRDRWCGRPATAARAAPVPNRPPSRGDRDDHAGDRSEEHTSELQSLLRTSYAVFCLKKKNIR